VHRDLKPENILVDKECEDCLKIIDFGLSVINKEKAILTQKYGTPYYMSPEVINNNYNEKCDVWSIGVILYILLCGVPPFYGETPEEIMYKVKT
jgi:calcium-dependent protein kinase